MVLLRILAVLFVLLLLWQPVATHRKLRALGAEQLRRSALLVDAYYAFIAGFIVLILAKDSRFFELLPDAVIGLVGTVGVALIPLTPLVMFAQQKLCRRRTGHCSCGYDLRGNPAGVCPECGRPAARDQSSPAPQHLLLRPRRAFLISLGLIALSCYAPQRSIYYCSECARKAARISQGVHILGTDFSWEVVPGLTVVRPAVGPPETALSKWLDPSRACQHNWQLYGATSYRLWGAARFSCGLDAAESVQAWETDFDTFMAAHPEVIPRIRDSLRRREPLRSWLDPMIVEWRGAPYGPDADPAQPDGK